MNSQENERWGKRLFGKNGLFITGISVVVLIIYEIGKNIFMDYVLSRLSQHGVVFNKVVEFIVDQPFLSSISFFVIVLSILFILDYIQFQKHKSAIVDSPASFVRKEILPQSTTIQKKEKNFKQKQQTAINKVSKLVNDAVEKSFRFSKGYALQNEPDMKEQAILAVCRRESIQLICEELTR